MSSASSESTGRRPPADVRVVLDTNVYVSAILFDGLPELPLKLARMRKLCLVTSEAIVAELIGVLTSKLGRNSQQLQDVDKELRRLGSVVATRSRLNVIREDDADNRVLECAVDGQVDLIVTGDRHLAALGSFAGIRIISPKAFAEALGLG